MSGGFAMTSPDSSVYQQQQPALPTSTVELSVRCDSLLNRDITSKSDPFCVFFMKNKAGHWMEEGRTEVVMNSLNPSWAKKFVVNYNFEERQFIKFEVYDNDSKANSLAQHDFLGSCENSLGNIVSSGRQFAGVLQGGSSSNKGKIFVQSEELMANKEVMKVQFAAKKLDKKDFLGKSDPFLVISKSSTSGQFVVVHKTEVIKNNLNPTWSPFCIPVRDLCNNDESRVLKFDVYDWDSDGSHDLIGSFKTDMKTLRIAQVEQKTFACINEKKASKSKYKNSGEVFVKSLIMEQQCTFLDYIQGGTTMNFSVAIDFTASNGPVQNQSSLHYMNPNVVQDNQYSTAIKAVGSIIQDYDTDKMFPGLGFGARVPPTGNVSHEFFLNLRQDNPYCQGVDGLLQAYYTSLQNVQLYGPTNFSPVIKHVARFASVYQDGSQYFVLLIITDGIITDMEDTKWAIIEASALPMSIIIVGVGNESFEAMNELDCDSGLLSQSGHKAKRDIVQFVRMKKFLTREGLWDKEFLAKEVLAEIPNQMVGWMKMKGIKPKTSPVM